jgi:DNA-nicking Smr family endonuclease
MSRRLTPEEERLWRAVTGRAAGAEHGRVRRVTPDEQRQWLNATGQAPTEGARTAPPLGVGLAPKVEAVRIPGRPRIPIGPPELIEPGRRRRIARERDPIEARIDLHGLDQDRARASLVRFIGWAQASGYRAVLVITGKGLRGDGVLRRMTPEWLAAAPLRALVAGISGADRRHGGEGAYYVTLRPRRSR